MIITLLFQQRHDSPYDMILILYKANVRNTRNKLHNNTFHIFFVLIYFKVQQKQGNVNIIFFVKLINKFSVGSKFNKQ